MDESLPMGQTSLGNGFWGLCIKRELNYERI